MQDTAQKVQEVASTIGDGALALGVMTSPWWLNLIEAYLHIYIVAGGAVLLTFRIRKAWLNRNK